MMRKAGPGVNGLPDRPASVYERGAVKVQCLLGDWVARSGQGGRIGWTSR